MVHGCARDVNSNAGEQNTHHHPTTNLAPWHTLISVGKLDQVSVMHPWKLLCFLFHLPCNYHAQWKHRCIPRMPRTTLFPDSLCQVTKSRFSKTNTESLCRETISIAIIAIQVLWVAGYVVRLATRVELNRYGQRFGTFSFVAYCLSFSGFTFLRRWFLTFLWWYTQHSN
jgi:hypothetical protein